MSSQFAFIPRKLAGKASKPSVDPSTTTHAANADAPVTAASSQSLVPKEKGKEKAKFLESKPRYNDEEYASLVCLALSDYALWSDSDLRRRIAFSGGTGESNVEDDGGFIPINYLLRHAFGVDVEDSRQTAIIKALRSYAGDWVQVRLLVSYTSSSQGRAGYEVRRKDWKNEDAELENRRSKKEWEKLTVYIENIPVQYRSIPGILKFTLDLLPSSSPSYTPTRIQNIHLPSHHQDKPGDKPLCKGFALVTFTDPQDVEFLLNAWPWERNTSKSKDKTASFNIKTTKVSEDAIELFEPHSEATTFGFRALPKAGWDNLKEEYLAYRQKLVEEIIVAEEEHGTLPVLVAPSEAKKRGRQDDGVHDEVEKVTSSRSIKIPFVETSTEETAYATTTNAFSLYPYNCLVFVRNVHPETNKTTLKKLFGRAFGNEKAAAGAMDYVDYNKGMDSCHLRFSTPAYAEQLVRFFADASIRQTNGLDNVGVSDSSNQTLKAQVVEGKREELYWEKVPEKVRKQAVERSLALKTGGGAEAVDKVEENEQNVNGKGRKKRRKGNSSAKGRDG